MPLGWASVGFGKGCIFIRLNAPRGAATVAFKVFRVHQQTISYCFQSVLYLPPFPNKIRTLNTVYAGKPIASAHSPRYLAVHRRAVNEPMLVICHSLSYMRQVGGRIRWVGAEVLPVLPSGQGAWRAPWLHSTPRSLSPSCPLPTSIPATRRFPTHPPGPIVKPLAHGRSR